MLRDILSENNPQHPVLLKIKELADEFSREIELGNTEYINNNDDVSVAGGDVEHNDTL
ncbi:hypothetical protein [Candidatus Tisiphia endosymbiont of Nedyus quadrimaculatus]|uniref:hypothetical protein n=1 Tax=Candidatus Tisiphia endosymbiont of Nedyus quadrimaculatus TaxID=3139332 RepID=UPI00345EA393